MVLAVATLHPRADGMVVTLCPAISWLPATFLSTLPRQESNLRFTRPRTRAAVPADHEAMLRHPREVVHMMTSLLIYMMGKLAVAVAGFEPAAAAL